MDMPALSGPGGAVLRDQHPRQENQHAPPRGFPSMTPKDLNYLASRVSSGLVKHHLTRKTLEVLTGPHYEEIIWLVYKRSRLNSRVALAMPDSWKEIAEDWARKRMLMPESTYRKVRKARAAFIAAPKQAYKIT